MSLGRTNLTLASAPTRPHNAGEFPWPKPLGLQLVDHKAGFLPKVQGFQGGCRPEYRFCDGRSRLQRGDGLNVWP